MQRIGFYGGSFNPPTKAHIELAKKAIKECELNKIIFVPVGDQYKKEEMAKALHRYNMLKLVCEEEDNLEISDIEIKSKENYKAIDIFEILENEYKQSENFFLMGVDNFKDILRWKDSNRLISNFNYIILDRGIEETKKIIENNELLKKNERRFTIIKNEEFKNCSSTYIRKQLKDGKKPENLEDKIYTYIIKNNIY